MTEEIVAEVQRYMLARFAYNRLGSAHKGFQMTVITFSPSVTLVATRACANDCLYCAFRKQRDSLVTDDEIERVINLGKKSAATEVLIMSGERPDQLPHIALELKERGFRSFVEFVGDLCLHILDNGLLPHINVGLLRGEELEGLKGCCASMGLMMEGDYGSLSRWIQPQKCFSQRMAHLRLAGELKIPFTTGILLGMGEAHEDRIRSLEAIASIQADYGHVQEIILQNYVPNGRFQLHQVPISLSEMEELISFVRREMPSVHVQFPPNLNSCWIELLKMGFDDLGGIGVEPDAINPNHPWPPVDEIKKHLEPVGFSLKSRLPLYPEFNTRVWRSARVGQVIEDIVTCRYAYQQYHDGGLV